MNIVYTIIYIITAIDILFLSCCALRSLDTEKLKTFKPELMLVIVNSIIAGLTLITDYGWIGNIIMILLILDIILEMVKGE